MKGQELYPATASNQITAVYYFCLVEQINNGTCSKSVQSKRKRHI